MFCPMSDCIVPSVQSCHGRFLGAAPCRAAYPGHSVGNRLPSYSMGDHPGTGSFGGWAGWDVFELNTIQLKRKQHNLDKA